MSVDETERAILAVIEAYREDECREARQHAADEGRTRLRQARREARERVRRAVMRAREGAEERLRAARAALATRQRESLQRRNAALLAAAWDQIAAALAARWQEPTSRRTWVGSAVDAALERLPREGWTLVHPPDWATEEQQAIVQRLGPVLNAPAHLEPDASLTAGIRLRAAGGAELDATLEGLLADRTRIEARILALLYEEAER